MQYNGGKHRQSIYIAPFINGFLRQDQPYFEPFVGGLNVPLRVRSDNMNLSDGNLALCSMWNAALDGYKFPEFVTEDQYYNAFELEDDNPLKAFILIGCSFGGVYKGGYARGVNGNYAGIAKRGIERKVSSLKGRIDSISHILWEDFSVAGTLKDSVIYLDPPYRNSRGYPGLPKFDSDKFWSKCNELAKNNIVLVSECDVPETAELLWERPITRTLGDKSAVRPSAVEKLVRVHHA